MIKLIHWLEQVNEWHFVWVSVILSEILTLIINTINSILWWGEISLDLLLIGTIDAFIVSLIVAGIVIFFIKRVKQLETNLTEPQLTEETLKDYAAKLAQSNDELAERNRQLLALQSAGATFTSSLDLEYVMNTVADEMISLLDVEGCALSEWNQADDTVTVIVEHGPDDWWSSGKPVKEVHHLQDYPLTKRALVERRVRQMTISQADIDPAELAYMQTAEITTLLLLPMIFHDQVIGLVELMDSRIERIFSDQELALVQLLANQAGSAIANARLYAETQRRLSEQSALREAGAIFSSTLDQQAVLSHIAEQLARITNATSAYICSYDSETMAAPVIAEYIAPHALPAEQVSDLGTAYLEDEIAFLETLNLNRPTISYVDGPDLPQAEREHMQRYGAQTILYLPLLIRGRPIGYAELWESRWKREFSPEEITLCQGIAQQAAIAIENTRLFEQAQQQIREREQAQEALRQKAQALTRSNELIAALSTVAAKIATTPDPDQVMTTLGEELKKLGMGCVVSQLDLEDQTFVAQYVPIESPLLNQIEKMLGLTINGLRISNWPQGKEIIQHNQPLFEPDFISTAVTALAPIPPLLVEQAARLVDIPRDSKAIYLPMVVTEQLRGLLTIWALDLQEEDTPALMIFANQVAITLENARLYRADQRQKVQLALTSQKLQQELRERKRAEEQIKVSLREKEVLLKEIHHRVKNNLQIISSLLSLQVGFIEDQQVLKIFRESEERIRSMALIHEKLYQSDNLAQIDFAEYIRELAGHLFRSYNGAARGIRLNLQSEDIWLNINIAVSCGLILNELIANSLKHAFPGDRRGEIHIRLYTDHDDQLILRVGDEGIGFPENLDFRHTTSLGLQLVDMLINQLDGTIELERNHGTTFKLTFAGK